MTKTPTLRSAEDARKSEDPRPEETKTWFTSDQHWGHTKIIHLADTRRFETIHAMNVAYVDAWNLQVGPQDLVYHLGDFCWGSLKDVENFASRLKGRIQIVPGNHDKWARQRLPEAALPLSASGYRIEVVDSIRVIRLREQTIVLCHYPMRSWPHSHYGSWHLYGHVHRPITPWGLSMDVGVDGSGGSLYSFDSVAEYMEQRRLALQAEGRAASHGGNSGEEDETEDV
jgi:calcineurin-like phosphoesterase family protein